MCVTALQSPRSHRVTAPDESTQPAAGNSKTHLLKCWCSRLICTLPLWRTSHCGIECVKGGSCVRPTVRAARGQHVHHA